MTLLYHDPIFLTHETGDHPESAGRLRVLLDRLEHEGLAARCRRVQSPAIDRRRLARVHRADYVDEIRAVAKLGGGHLDADTICSPASYGVALHAAGACCDAVARVLRGEDRQGLCLVRPPGHHALAGRAMGFCLFNNVAVAARMAVDEFQLARVLIVDWDIHHGNGTQATFWEDPQVGFLSAHRWPFYPGTGDDDEIGGGHGLGTTVNLPIRFGTPRATYLAAFARALESLADRMRPELVLVSAGFDCHRLDPVGNLGLESEDFRTLTELVLDVAETHAGGRLVSVLEGGYHPQMLAESLIAHLEALLARD